MANNGQTAPTPLALSEPKVEIRIDLKEAYYSLEYELERYGFTETRNFLMSIFHLLVMEAMSYCCAWDNENHVEQAVQMILDLQVVKEDVAVGACRICSEVIYSTLSTHIPFFGGRVTDGSVTFNILPADTDIAVYLPGSVVRAHRGA